MYSNIQCRLLIEGYIPEYIVSPNSLLPHHLFLPLVLVLPHLASCPSIFYLPNNKDDRGLDKASPILSYTTSIYMYLYLFKHLVNRSTGEIDERISDTMSIIYSHY